MEIRVLKNEPVDWKKAQWFQTKTFKEIGEQQFEKLINSMLSNDYIESLKVWQDKRGVIWILDGHHRQRALLEMERRGHKIPDLLPAEFIDCQDRKQAAKFCVVYASTYARITEPGLQDMLMEFDLSLDDINDMVEIPGIDFDGIGGEEPHVGKGVDWHRDRLKEQFIIPPFSVLEAKTGYWQERKRHWFAIIGDNSETREGKLGLCKFGDPKYGKNFGKKFSSITTSVLDPVLAEICCKWFGLPDCATCDPFAGDTVFGYVSASLGNSFVGTELRQEQTDVNNQRVTEAGLNARYICDDGQNIGKHVQPGSIDLLFSCPPYFDLERYSDLPNDASNQGSFGEFCVILKNAFSAAVDCLREDRFAVIVCGDVRDKQGVYRDLPGEIRKMFCDFGLHLYNDIILYDMIGTAAIRAAKYMKSRKVVKVHQNVLVFYKGDIKNIKTVFPALDFSSPETMSDEQEEGEQ